MYDQGPQATTGHLDLLDALPIMILDVDRDGNLLFANKKVRERLGLPSVLEDITLGNILEDASLKEAMKQLQELFSGEGDLTSTWKMKPRTGSAFQVDTNVVSIYENGYPVRVRTYLHDGSEVSAPAAQALAGPADVRAALKEEQEYTKALIQKSGLMVYILDTKNNVVEINKKMEEVTGFTRETVPTLDHLLAGLYPDAKYRSIVQRIHENMYKNQHIRETELSISTQTGDVKHVSWSTARLKNAKGQVHGFIAMGMDMSEKKRLEQWLKLQSSCFDRVADAVVVSDLKGAIINWVGGAERMLGWTAKEMTQKPLTDLFPPEYRTEINASLSQGIERDGRWSGEMVLTTQEGRKIAVRLDAAVVLNEKSAPIATVTVIHDQTREKQQEMALSEIRGELEQASATLGEREQSLEASRARTEELERRVDYLSTKNRDIEMEANRLASGRVALEEAIKELSIYQLQVMGTGTAALVTFDPAGTVLTWSRGAEELTRMDAKEAFNRHHDEVFKLEEFDWEGIQSEAIQTGRVVLPCTLVRADGSRQPISLEVTVLTDESGQPIGFTEVALPPQSSGELEKAILEARALSAVGELSIGFARDLGDAFSAANVNLSRLTSYVTDLKKVVELYRSGYSNRDIEAFVRRIDLPAVLNDVDALMEESREGLVRIRNLARDLQSFLPGDPAERVVVNLNELAESALALLRTDLNHRARLEKDYADPILVPVHRHTALRALLELSLLSARSFEVSSPTRNELKVRTFLEGTQAVVEISHNGKALAPDLADHLDDLTWLSSQKGLAPLALGLVQKCVASLEGKLEVLSPGDGLTAFRVSLPAAEPPAPPSVEGRDSEISGSVLIVDDDKNQLRSYRRYFERMYQVFPAETAAEALNALAVRSDFSAVVMDLLMPEAEGLKLYHDLVEKYPALKEKLVFVVPPGLSLETRHLLLNSGHIVLHKPIEIGSLATVLRLITQK